MKTLGTYTFLPWLRQGLAGMITATDNNNTVMLRATVRVDLKLSGEPVEGGAVPDDPFGKDVQIYGPGDIVGIDSRSVVRVEPRNWITNFEPNYLAHIEFYDEDFPWRYTPAAPNALQLRPWIMLVVLKESEFSEGNNFSGKPLPFITASDINAFPPADQLWAWAHVHVNQSLAADAAEFVSLDMNAVLPKFQAVLNQNPDLAFSRIVCPRRLAANEAYHAFVVPVFESGRLASLGLDPSKAPHATFSAWANYAGREEPTNFPIYYRWFFRTGEQEDFESLVRLLKAKPVSPKVGKRPMDVVHPAPKNLPPINNPDIHGVLKLGGALRVPLINFTQAELDKEKPFEEWAKPYPNHPFQKALAAFINLPDDYEKKGAPDPDPLITAPLYGRWHALTSRLLVDINGDPISPNENWIHELNLDPRYRVPAGFGTRVVQKYQEDYMQAAWEQVGDVLEANKRIRAALFAREVSLIWYTRHLAPIAETNIEKALMLTAPVHSRIVADDFTLHHQKTLSLMPPVYTSATFRRMIRPRGRLIKSLPFNEQIRSSNLLARVNEGLVSAAPPKVTPPGITTVNQASDNLIPKSIPAFAIDWLRKYPWLPTALFIAAIIVFLLSLILALFLIFVLGFGIIVGVIVLLVGLIIAALLVWLAFLLRRWAEMLRGADSIRESNLTPQAVDTLPSSPNFVTSDADHLFTPRRGGSDSGEAARFKKALRDWHALFQATRVVTAEPPRVKLNLTDMTSRAVAGLDPEVTIPRRALHGIFVPLRIRELIDETFDEVMNYPRIDDAMYKPLTDIDPELFLPNINLIEQNSITLLETNQKFIEAYMVGLNHEFSRELLWREYPTDQRGSYFRQFWDVSAFLDPKTRSDDERREALYDIFKLHEWKKNSQLDDHDNRERPGDKEDEVVLVIRGELLKKYPNAVIYAHHAQWRMKNGKIDPTQERDLEDPDAIFLEKPPRDKVRTPLYEAKVAPDIYFFGFDLTAEVAKGGTGEHPTDDPGWFFVIKERPGEPRFGFDISRTGPIQTVNDIAWNDALPGDAAGAFLNAGSLSTVDLKPLGPDDQEKKDQRDEDLKVVTASVSAARWAYLTFQAPMMVAIHAGEMLKQASEVG